MAHVQSFIYPDILGLGVKLQTLGECQGPWGLSPEAESRSLQKCG